MTNISSAILLGMLGDIIGFGNGKIEFNNDNFFTKDNYDNYEQTGADYSNQMVFDFINNGGFSQHPKGDWTVSDDTIMTLANARALIEWDHVNGDIDSLTSIVRTNYIKIIDRKQDLENFERIYKGGITTISNLKKLKNGDDYKTFAYNDKSGGSGGTMRSAIFGYILHGDENKLKLLAACIETTCLTHPNAIAFLGSVVVGFFASYARDKMRPEKWCIEIIELLESDIIDNYIRKHKSEMYSFYDRDKKIFITKWRDYIEDKFPDQTFVYKKSMIMKFPSQRSLYYNRYSSRKNDIYPGAGGDDSVIIAYDVLLSCGGSWEKVVTYSMLHVGDSDTTGTICGFLYGLYYGSDKVGDIMIDNIVDHIDEAKVIINKLKKF